MILYRPVGLEELLLIYKSRMRRFPPRLPEQPIFYPVLTLDYAREIAQKWNATRGSQAGYITEFEVDEPHGRSFPVQQVGSVLHQELWVPAYSLNEFNEHIIGPVRLIGAHFGSAFSGVVPAAFSLKGKHALAQLEALQDIFRYSLMDFHGEITANHEVIYVHYPYWEQIVGKDSASEAKWRGLLNSIHQIWSNAFPDISIGVQLPRAITQR